MTRWVLFIITYINKNKLYKYFYKYAWKSLDGNSFRPLNIMSVTFQKFKKMYIFCIRIVYILHTFALFCVNIQISTNQWSMEAIL